MCGMYGVIGQGIVKSDNDIFYELGVANLLRGVDASGIIFGNTRYENRALNIYKQTGDYLALSYKVEGKESILKEFESISNTLYLGHNRHTTVGSDIADAAHPYSFPSFIGMHNGTIQSDHIRDYVSKDDGKDEKLLTDSQVLMSLIEKDGLDQTLCGLNDAKDAYSIVLWLKKKKRIQFVRNSKRPMCFAVNKKRGVMYYSSEEGALDYVLGRNGIEYKKYEPDVRTVFEVDPLRIDMNGLRSWTNFDLGPTTYVAPPVVASDTKYIVYKNNIRTEVSKEEYDNTPFTTN